MAVTLPGIQVISESLAPVGGFVNGCGQAAVLMMEGITQGKPVDANTLSNMIKFSIATGHATQSGSHIGSTNPQQLQWLAEQQGVKTQLGSGANWKATVDAALPQGRPVVLGVANAKAFGGSDANVSGHYVTLVGTTTDGRYIVADPNQQAAKSGSTVVYSASQINAARPFATLVPVGAVQATTTADTSSSDQYSVGPLWPGGSKIGLDPLVDGIIRGSLILVGVSLVLIAILIFTRKDIPRVAEAGIDVAKVAAA